MFTLNMDLAVYLHRDAIDFRLAINGLAALVEHQIGHDPFARAIYVFRNRRCDRIKLLGWHRNGFWLLQKRLEGGRRERFIWPRDEAPVIHLTVQQLHWLIDGIDLKAMCGHQVVHYRSAA